MARAPAPPLRPAVQLERLRATLRYLYEAQHPPGAALPLRPARARPRLASLVALVSFLPRMEVVLAFEAVLGLVLLTEFVLRHLASRRPLRDLLRPTHLARPRRHPLAAAGAHLSRTALGFLRALRFLRVLHSVRLATSLGARPPLLQRNEEAIIAAAQFVVFVFIMTGLVYETQIGRNDHIRNYGDSLYFTVTALTTTGFGDITLPGTTGRLLSVIIMICGVTLFLRLAQAMFRPVKVASTARPAGCHATSPMRCTARPAAMLNIPDEGID